MGAEAEVFPAWTEADWRKAAEKALKGASLDKLVTRTADGLRIEPVYQPGDGPRALRAGGPWRVIARLDHPDAREANAQALEDLAGGADGLQVVFTGAIGSYGFGLKRSDPETLSLAFDNIQFDAGTRFELDLGPNGPAEALAFANHIRDKGAEPAISAVSFGLDPFAAASHGPFPSGWAGHVKPYVDASLELKAGRFNGPFFVADARSVHAAGGSASQELAFAVGAGVSILRALGEAGVSPDKARAHDRLPSCVRRGRIYRAREVPGAAHPVGAGRGGLRAFSARGRSSGGERLADDDPARSLRERDARIDRRLFGRPRWCGQRERAAAFRSRSAYPAVWRDGSPATDSSSSCANPISASSKIRPRARAASRR